MKLLVVSRNRWTVLAICSDTGCPLRDALDDLEEGLKEDGRKILRRFEAMAVNGPPRNKQLARPLGDKIFEIKAQRGLIRVFCFYDEGRMVICTHLVTKPKQRQLQAEMKKAKEIRKAYLAAKGKGRVEILEEL